MSSPAELDSPEVPRGDEVADLLPPPPANVPANLTQATTKYKRHAWIAGLGLLGFVALYISLTLWFCWTSYQMFASMTRPGHNGFWSFCVGLLSGILGIFLLSAFFSLKAGGDPKSHEITAKDQPELFAFLNALADRVGAPRPHRVFISAGVNAGVFYDLSVANLLIPTKKNLTIGLGLVNCLNLSEFTAVLAHEFGHFAQKSMAVGRWVYTAQQAAGQIVVARGWLDKTLAVISATDIRIAWIGWIMRLIVWSIRSLLDTAFRLVVLAERALGREMEFQADLVSVSVTGSDPLIHALHRLGAADMAWNVALAVLNRQLHRGREVPDLFALQSRIVEHMSRILNDSEFGASPKVPEEHPEQHRVFKQQLAESPRMWSTHPPNRDREVNAKRVYVPSEIDSRSAFCLFRNPSKLRKKITAAGYSEVTKKLKKLSKEDALAAVDERFSSTLFHERHRGIYLGRAIGLATKNASSMVGKTVKENKLRERLSELYPESLASDIRELRERTNERAALEALRDGILDAPGGVIQHRGQTIPRKRLAALIDEVSAEVNETRRRIEEHDRACRAAHLAAARVLGQGWEPYLVGLTKLHHYAAHAEANLDDARGHVANVFAIVTADGRVSSAERRRLIIACSEVHSALEQIHQHRKMVTLPDEALQRLWKALGTNEKKKPPSSYDKFYGDEFKLPDADEQNIGQWLQVIDSWIDEPLTILGALERVSLELLVEAEEHVRTAYEQGTDPGPAPEPAEVPERYQTLTAGEARERQKHLDFWDRFQIADGFFPTVARLAVAGGILASVIAATPKVEPPPAVVDSYVPPTQWANLTIINGLDVPIVVQLPAAKIHLQAHDQVSRIVGSNPTFQISAWSESDEEIETIVRSIEAPHTYTYNVARATSLVQSMQSPGLSTTVGERTLGALQWYASNEDATFQPWRAEQQRRVGFDASIHWSTSSNQRPSSNLSGASDETTRNQMILAHVKWDLPDTRWIRDWLNLGQSLPNFDAVLVERNTRYFRDISTWRLRLHRASGETRKMLCDKIKDESKHAPENLNWQYLLLVCAHDEEKNGKVFVDAFRKNPNHPHFADSAVGELCRQKKYDDAIKALEAAASTISLAEDRNLFIARLLRLSGNPKAKEKINSLMEQSRTLESLIQLDSGEGIPESSRAFHLLRQGRVDDAVKIAKADPAIYRDVLLRAAASDGATREIINDFWNLPSANEASNSTWIEIALLDREGLPHAQQDALVERHDVKLARDLLPFASASFLDKGRARVEAAWSKLHIQKQAYACVMTLIRKRDSAPTSCRSMVQKFFFAPEVPYFK